jgi:hypothetical protein
MEVHLINFDGLDAINELLERIGIASKLGPFLAEHLTKVLRKQRPDVAIVSIKFVGAGDCSAEGEHRSQGQIVQLDSLCIPIDTHVILVSNSRMHQLDLNVRIMASASDGAFDIKTDVIVQHQSIV